MKVTFELGQHPDTGRHYLLYRFEAGWTMRDVAEAGAQGKAAVEQLPPDEMVDSVFWLPPGERFNFTNLIQDVRRVYNAPLNNRIRTVYIVGLDVFGRAFLSIVTRIAQRYSPEREVLLDFDTLEQVLEAMKVRDTSDEG